MVSCGQCVPHCQVLMLARHADCNTATLRWQLCADYKETFSTVLIEYKSWCCLLNNYGFFFNHSIYPAHTESYPKYYTRFPYSNCWKNFWSFPKSNENCLSTPHFPHHSHRQAHTKMLINLYSHQLMDFLAQHMECFPVSPIKYSTA